jgi:tRNA(fMet)-specific endonuclease VapC
MLILDTDLLSVVQRREGALYDRLDARLEEASVTELIGVTIVSFEEQTRGWLAYIAKARSSALQIEAYARLHGLLRDFSIRHVLDYDEAAVQQYDQLARARIRIGTMDLKIAAIALANQATLLSSNLSDFQKVPGLRVEDWTRP